MNNVYPTLPCTNSGQYPVMVTPSAAMHPDGVKRVLRNTNALLAMTLLFSAAVAVATLTLALPAPGLVITLIGYFGLLYAVFKLQSGAWALPTVFATPDFAFGFVASAYTTERNL